MDIEKLQEYWGKLQDKIVEFAPNIVMALVILFVGLWVIRNLEKIVSKMMERSGLNEDIRPFLVSLMSVGLKVLLIFSVAGMVGIETTSFVAVMAAAGFAIGMALQGSLGNFAAGVMILIFKPFRTGDWIDVQDKMGKVTEIQMFNTIMKTLDNKMVIIPNAMAIGDVVTNLSTNKYIRVDLTAYMPYEEEFDKVQPLLVQALQSIPEVLEDPAPEVGILEFDSHSIILAIRPCCLPDDYGKVHLESLRKVKQAMGHHNIRVAYSEGVELGKIGK